MLVKNFLKAAQQETDQQRGSKKSGEKIEDSPGANILTLIAAVRWRAFGFDRVAHVFQLVDGLQYFMRVRVVGRQQRECSQITEEIGKPDSSDRYGHNDVGYSEP